MGVIPTAGCKLAMVSPRVEIMGVEPLTGTKPHRTGRVAVAWVPLDRDLVGVFLNSCIERVEIPTTTAENEGAAWIGTAMGVIPAAGPGPADGCKRAMVEPRLEIIDVDPP